MCGREAVNGSLSLGRLHLCNLLPGNTTGSASIKPGRVFNLNSQRSYGIGTIGLIPEEKVQIPHGGEYLA